LIPITSLPLTPPLQPPGLSALQGVGAPGASTAPGAAGNEPFKNILIEALGQVNSMQNQADQAVQQLVTGDDVNPAEVLTTLQKADISFQLMLQIRNKLVAAYQEVNNIRI
jgi:flagellar hook-basal body complex protein FliE